MRLWSESFENGSSIPDRLAFARPHPETHVELSENRNPQLAWSDLPTGARSLALICHDPDAPTRPDLVNQEGITIPADLARADFYHWAVVDLAPDASPLAEAEFSDGVTAKGKRDAAGPRGCRQGSNGYTGWFADDADMGGTYLGYDGPCPPWNDERVHHYHFTLYALDLEKCPVAGDFSAENVLTAIQGHVLGKASIVGSYTLNPAVR